MKLVIATGNRNKVLEISQLLPTGMTLVTLEDIGFTGDIPETSDTIAGNSMQKARYLKDVLGRDGFAEDTGLEVKALGGEPGVLSARYAGPEKDADANMELVLERMEGVADRQARFITVITLILGGGVHQFEGRLEGSIATVRSGSHGFGYDPIFRLADGRSLAQLTLEEKSRISHRARAVISLRTFLKDRFSHLPGH